MRGRKPKPQVLKALEGNRGKRKQTRKELQPDPTLPKCPQHLNAVAKEQWHNYADELNRLGLLTSIDAPWFGELCFNIALSYQAQEKLEEMGPVVEIYDEDEKGYLYIKEIRRNPWIMVEKQASERILRIMSEAGMTPVSRSRASSGKKKREKANPLQAWLQQKGAQKRTGTAIRGGRK